MKQLRKNILLIVLFFTAIMTRGQVYHNILTGKESEWSLANNMYYFALPNPITANEAFDYLKKVQADSIGNSNFKRGYDSKYYWFYFRLKNDSIPKTVVLTFSRSDIHHFNCFSKKGGMIDTLAITGDALPFSSRPVKVNDYAVPISLQANEEIEILTFIDKRFEFIEGEFRLFESNHFFSVKRYEFGFYMAYIGVMFMLLIFNLFLWLSLKDNVHLYFIAHLISSTLCLYTSLGLLNEFLPFDMPYRTSSIVVAMSNLWSGSHFLLMNSFLKLNPKTSRFYTANQWIGFGNFFIGFSTILILIFQQYPLTPFFLKGALVLLEIVYLINILFSLGIFIEQFIRRNAMARLYGFACFFTIAGFSLSIVHRNSSLNLNGYLSFFSQSLGWIMSGVLFEQLILALSLTIRYNLLKRDNLELEVNLTKVKNEISGKIIETQETERQRLAKDLHDDLGGTLSAIKGRVANEKVQSETLNLVEKAINDLRLVSRNLMPPELANEGLVRAVYYTIERIQSTSDIAFTFITFGEERRLKQDIELNIYRMIAELINNILKHSKAKKAVIQLIYYKDYLSISVEDDGSGIKKSPNDWGIGLKNINSRVEFLQAKINIDSGHNTGTTIMVQVPILCD
jgi:signal transduction histidine kinase